MKLISRYRFQVPAGIILLGMLLMGTGTSVAQQAQVQLQITSPSDGSIVVPGQTISVLVASPTGTSFANVAVVGTNPIGISDVASSVPAQFSITLPADAANRQYALAVVGTTSTGVVVQSPIVRIFVERQDPAIAITGQPNTLVFQSLGQQLPLNVSATYADGSVTDITESSNLTYTSSDRGVATVDSNGIVTAVAPGDAIIKVRYDQGAALVPQIGISVKVLTPALTPSPIQLSFGGESGVNVGTSVSTSITLTNTTKSNNKLKTTGIAATGDFLETDDCISSSPMAVGSTCTVTVTFAPTVGGTRTGTLSVSNSFSSTMSIPLTGSANNNFNISVSPGSQTVSAGGSATYTVSASIFDGFSGAISLGTSGLPSTVAPNFDPPTISTDGGTSTLTVATTASTTPGDYSFTVTGTNGAQILTASPTLTVTQSVPAATLLPNSLIFAPQNVGAAGPVQTITLTSSGSGALAITSIAATGDFAQTNNCGTTLAAGANCAISVTFTPTALGPRTGALIVVDNAAGSPHSASLNGTGAVLPSVSSLIPNVGPSGTNLPITITGINFGATQGTSTVAFGGVNATIMSWSDTSIAGNVPSGLPGGLLNVVVTVNGVASNAATFSVMPSITGLSATTGAAGTPITITGTSFGATQDTTSTVTFNGVAAAPTSWSNTSITAPVPTGATSGPIVVTVNGFASNSVNFTVPTPPPSIISLSPPSGAIGSSVVITGANFGATQNGSVFFTQANHTGVVATVTSWSDTSITAIVPNGAVTGNVKVVVNGQLSNKVVFTVTP